MQQWLGRFAFSFLVIGAFLLWMAWKAVSGQSAHAEGWRIALYMVAAMLCFVMGALGIRQRHK